ncbi:MAG: hypothetical protein RL514_721 [Verrucomicrobiota bacterium]|jgi:uncharacterized delta-60 repeat protein
MRLQHILLAILTLGTASIAAEYTVSLLPPTALGGKTLWVDVTEKTGTAAYATAGQSHQVFLTATGTTNGTFTVPAAPGVAARSGTWTAGLPGGLPQGPGNYLFINFVGLVGDATVDNFTFYPAFGTANQIPCNYYLYRGTGLPIEALNNQRGYVRVTDGEAPTPFAPTITFAVGGSTYFTGANAKLRVDVVGSFPLSYQWSKGGPAILNATNATLDFSAIQLTDAGTYTVLVSNSAGSATTNLSIAVNASTPPAITTQPVGVSVVVNQTVNLSVVATGTDPLAYQWRKNGVAVVTNASVFGATGPTLTIFNPTVTAMGDYTVVITNYAGAITSAVATVTVTTPSAPVFTLQPPAFVPLLTNATFTVTAAVVGVPTPLLQWQKGGVNIVGATNATYTRRDTNYNAGANYRLIAGNASGSVTSSVALVSVYDSALYYNNPQPTNAVLPAGGTLLQRAAAYGLPPINFTLRRNGTNVPGFISLPQNYFPEPYSGYRDLAVPNLQPLDSGAYTIVVSNTVGGVSTSAVFNVSIQSTSAPVILQPPTNTVVFLRSSGTIVSEQVTYSSFFPVTVQWLSNSVVMAGQSSSNLTLSFNSPAQFDLQAVLSNQVGATTSGVARVSVTFAAGAVDSNFVSTVAIAGQAYTLAALPNSNVLAGGNFTAWGASNRNYLVELAANGAVTPWLAHTNGLNGTVFALHRYGDGKLLVGGAFTNAGISPRYSGLLRLNADGTLDSTFSGGSTDGSRYVDHTVSVMAVRTNDGHLAIAGTFTNVAGQTQRRLALLDSNGVFQSSFRPLITNSPGQTLPLTVASLAFQPDGKLLVGGNFGLVNGLGRTNLARLNTDGTLDTGFNVLPITYGVGVVGLLVQADGRICLSGNFSSVAGPAGTAFQTRNAFARVQADGTLDPINHPTGSGAGVMILQPGGNVIVAGYSLQRFLPNNSLDAFFPGNGYGTINNGAQITSLAFSPDGSLWIGGSFISVGGITQQRVARLNMDTAAPLASPSLGQILFSAGNFRFRLPTAAQRNYRVEMKSNLTDPSWQTHQNFTGDGAEREITVTLPLNTPRAFFRIVAD